MQNTRKNDSMIDSYQIQSIDLQNLDASSRQEALKHFSDQIHYFYQHEGRSFPWRDTVDPYRIILSELMLQQTQTERVLPKYELFLTLWPDFSVMAKSTLSEVLSAWRGLGYNRRALALRTIAQRSEAYGWTLPADYNLLIDFPMIGPATAAAIMAFAYGKRSIYLETNIRRVLIHQFHPEQSDVTDTVLRGELEELADLQDDYKRWYYALMDYGVLLKKQLVNPNRRSAHYQKQAAFANSNRQIRGLLLTAFTEQGTIQLSDVYERIPFPAERVQSCLDALVKEGFIEKLDGVSQEDVPYYGIPSGR